MTVSPPLRAVDVANINDHLRSAGDSRNALAYITWQPPSEKFVVQYTPAHQIGLYLTIGSTTTDARPIRLTAQSDIASQLQLTFEWALQVSRKARPCYTPLPPLNQCQFAPTVPRDP